MTRTVFCKKYKEELEGMSSPPYPGEKGEEIFNTVSKKKIQMNPFPRMPAHSPL